MEEGEDLAGLRVAVVEDDPELRGMLVSELADRRALPVGLDSSEALYRHLVANPCDIVVLDLMLPGEDGYAAAAHLRQASPVGIVMLTGRGAPRDVARGLTEGADLYLVKPVDMEVLAAGLLTLRRRLQAAAAPVPAAPEAPRWRMEAAGWRLRAPDGACLELAAAERAFLRALFAAPGQPVDRDVLIAAITDTPWDFDPHRLEMLVHRLRARVRRVTGMALPVRALRGVGYLILPEPEEA